jgi:hypothetical protein
MLQPADKQGMHITALTQQSPCSKATAAAAGAQAAEQQLQQQQQAHKQQALLMSYSLSTCNYSVGLTCTHNVLCDSQQWLLQLNQPMGLTPSPCPKKHTQPCTLSSPCCCCCCC